MKILIAEEGLVSRNLLCRLLGKYGQCDLAVDGLEAIDAFLIAIKDNDPYRLILLDAAMPKLDGVRTLRAIRYLERQYGFDVKRQAKIILTTAQDMVHLGQEAMHSGCDAHTAKPADPKDLADIMGSLGFSGGLDEKEQVKASGNMEKQGTKHKNTTKRSMQKSALPSTISVGTGRMGDGYFKSVSARPGYHLNVIMETGTAIRFDFCSRLNTARFGALRDEELFQSARTDGNYLIFEKPGRMTVRITAAEFMDLVLIDRRK